MKKGLFLLLIMLAVLISGCVVKKDIDYTEECGTENPDPTKCEQSYVNCVAYNYMKDWYLWYEHLPEINIADYATLGDMLSKLKYVDGETVVDRFSYSVKKVDHDNYYAGKRYGMGTSWKRDEANRLFVSLVYPESPAGIAGLKRGQEILELNGFTVAQLDKNKLYNQEHAADEGFIAKTDWDNVYDAEKQGEAVAMKLLENGTDEINTTVYLDDYTMKSVLKTSVVDNNGVKTGYLHFKAFITPSKDELNEAFVTFKAEEIQELVLDMRYNGGGLVSISQHLINLIAGPALEGEKIIKIMYNDKHSDSNSNYLGKVLENSMNLKKVAIIASRGTASASEMVINSLAPFIEVSVIGDTTYGKPVGMNALDICDQTIVPITFKNANAVDFGDYYFGIPATCTASDDYKHDFGDVEEASMKEALYYLKNGKCSETLKNYGVKGPLLETLIPFELKGMNRIDYTF